MFIYRFYLFILMEAYKSIFLFFVLIGSLSFISAENYSIVYNQVGNKVVINETIGGISKTYVDSSILEKTRGGYYFVEKINFDRLYGFVEIKLILNKGSVVSLNEAYPGGYYTGSNGQNIELIWRFYNVSIQDPIAFFVKIEDTEAFYKRGLAFFILIVIILASSVGFWFYYKKKNKNKFESHLMESEKKVIEELKKAEKNEMWQKHLLLNTGFSKAKLSRVIRDLESRNLVRKVPYGNTNKIGLT